MFRPNAVVDRPTNSNRLSSAEQHRCAFAFLPMTDSGVRVHPSFFVAESDDNRLVPATYDGIPCLLLDPHNQANLRLLIANEDNHSARHKVIFRIEAAVSSCQLTRTEAEFNALACQQVGKGFIDPCLKAFVGPPAVQTNFPGKIPELVPCAVNLRGSGGEKGEMATVARKFRRQMSLECEQDLGIHGYLRIISGCLVARKNVHFQRFHKPITTSAITEPGYLPE